MKQRWWSLQKVFQLGLVATLLLSIVGLLGSWHYLLELTTHFKVQYFVIGCTAGIFFSLKRHWRWVSISLCCIFLNLSFILPWYFPHSYQAIRQNPLSLLIANVNVGNKNYAATLSLIQQTQPDLFVLIESNRGWLQALESAKFPYSLQTPHAETFGIALYSKFPLQTIAIKTLPDSDVSEVEDYHLAATVNQAGKSITIIAIHPPPPKTATLVSLRNQELQNVGEYIRQSGTTIVAGDFNTTMWSSAYRRFEQTTGLKNTRRGFGILPTWTTRLPLLLIPIDHCLASPDLSAQATRTTQNIGSDHLPLLCQLKS